VTKRAAQPKQGEPIRLVYTKAGEPRYKVVIDTARPGEPRCQVQSTHRTLTEAREHVARTRADLSRGTYAAPVKVTFKDLSVEYLARVERGDHGRKAVRPSTLAGYKAAMARACDVIGSRPVADLTYKDISGMVDSMSSTHSVKSVALALTLVRSTLAYAVRHKGLPRNVAEGVSAQGKPPVGRQAYTVEQVRDLSRASEGDRLAGVWAVILIGLRRGEVLGLRWGDVDLDAGTLTVARSRVWLSGGFTDGEPKTARGRRTVALDPVTISRLRAMRKTHAVERLAVGVGLTDDDVLAATDDGSPMRPETLTTEWKRLCKRAKVTYLGLHAARHGHVKMLRAAGLPDGVIAARLGHDESVMRTVYGVPHASEQAQAAEVMGRLLG
jgi:integrase